jgi:ATP-binding cassette subfamily F protein 3
MLLKPINFLVMDEPTNHLDLISKDVLKQALQKYDGTMVIVSHDRDFLNGLTDNVYEFKDGKVKQYLGGIEYFLEQRKVNNLREVEKKTIERKEAKKNKSDHKESFKRKKEREKNLRKLKNQFSKLEETIESLETNIGNIDADMMDPEKFKKLSVEPDFYAKYEKLKEELNASMTKWEELSETIETEETALEQLN